MTSSINFQDAFSIPFLKRKIWIPKFPLLDTHRSFCNLALAAETDCSCCCPQPSVIEANAVSAKTLCLLRVKVLAFPMLSCQGLWAWGDRVVIWRGEGSEWRRSGRLSLQEEPSCVLDKVSLPEHGSPSLPARLGALVQGPAGTYNHRIRRAVSGRDDSSAWCLE